LKTQQADTSQSIPASLAILGRYFPTGFDAARAGLYEEQLTRQGFQAEDVAEARERIIRVRESRTFPQLAEILRHTKESRADRLRAKDEPLRLESGMVNLGPQHHEELAVWRNLASLGVFHCDTRGAWSAFDGDVGPERESWASPTGMCDCAPVCAGLPVSLATARWKLSWARANEPALRAMLPPDEPPVKGFSNVGAMLKASRWKGGDVA